MSAPTPIKRAHYDKLVCRQVPAILWEKIKGQALPVLLPSGWAREGNAATAAVLMDPACNGPSKTAVGAKPRI